MARALCLDVDNYCVGARDNAQWRCDVVDLRLAVDRDIYTVFLWLMAYVPRVACGCCVVCVVAWDTLGMSLGHLTEPYKVRATKYWPCFTQCAGYDPTGSAGTARRKYHSATHIRLLRVVSLRT